MIPNQTTRFFYTIVDEQVIDPNTKSIELNHTTTQVIDLNIKDRNYS